MFHGAAIAKLRPQAPTQMLGLGNMGMHARRGPPLLVFRICQSSAVRSLLSRLGHSWGWIWAQSRKRSVAASQPSWLRSSWLRGAGSWACTSTQGCGDPACAQSGLSLQVEVKRLATKIRARMEAMPLALAHASLPWLQPRFRRSSVPASTPASCAPTQS